MKPKNLIRRTNKVAVIRNNWETAQKVYERPPGSVPGYKTHEGLYLSELARKQVPYSSTTSRQDIIAHLRLTYEIEKQEKQHATSDNK